MITTLRVWFTWPLSGAAGLIHVAFLLRSGLESVIALRQKQSRRQGFIALVMVLLTFLICLVIGFFFLMMATGLSP